MKNLWYVSDVAASTVAAPRLMVRRHFARWTSYAAAALLSLAGMVGCAGSSSAAAGGGAPAAAPIGAPGARDANLAGARCAGGAGAPCSCRARNGEDNGEKQPPDADHKRFEIRLAGTGGGATLDSNTLGHFTAGGDETCFYVDVLPGTTNDVTFTARSATPEGGVGPELQLAEYGPKGPWWYDILDVSCRGPGDRCNRDAADSWSAVAKHRQRGRIDPCGSTVISHLRWDTSGGIGERDLGLFRDFTVQFTMEVKRFPTQFHPGATECVPK